MSHFFLRKTLLGQNKCQSMTNTSSYLYYRIYHQCGGPQVHCTHKKYKIFILYIHKTCWNSNESTSCFTLQFALSPSLLFFFFFLHPHTWCRSVGDTLKRQAKGDVGKCWWWRREANNVASPGSRSVHYEVRLLLSRNLVTAFKRQDDESLLDWCLASDFFQLYYS